jgi:hypothetical protein
MNSDDEDQYMTEDQRRVQASAKRRAEKGSYPMTTRLQAQVQQGDQRVSKVQVPTNTASGVGGLRLAVGSGQKSTRVRKGHPPKT